MRELTRVAVRETEHEWLEFTRGKTLRQLEQALAGKHSGDTPAFPPDLSAQRHVLRFDVAGETFALFRDALNELRRRTDEMWANSWPSGTAFAICTCSTWSRVHSSRSCATSGPRGRRPARKSFGDLH